METETCVLYRRSAVSGFALVELLALIVIAVLIMSLLAVAGKRSADARLLGQDMAKLRTLGAATFAFALDNNDQLWSLSWQGGVQYNSPWPDLNFAPTDIQAAANQAVVIMRTRTGRTDIPRISNWLPYLMYSHLVLVDYFEGDLPWDGVISAADRDRLLWASDPERFDRGGFAPCQPNAAPHATRWPYSASFQLVPAAWDRGEPPSRVGQGGSWGTYTVPTTADLGPGLLTDVAFPSRKVLAHDTHDRHSGWPNLAFAHREARLPLLFADGRARMKHTADANPGWTPNQPRSAHPQWMQFPAWFQACEVGGPAPQVGPNMPAPGVYRWTRGGLAGRDFAGPEINTGQPLPLERVAGGAEQPVEAEALRAPR